jgi:hypothetical protein
MMTAPLSKQLELSRRKQCSRMRSLAALWDDALRNTPQNERMIAGAILIFWSQMHGLTLLLVDRLVSLNGNTDELAESVLQGVLEGLATRIPVLPPGECIGP